MPFLQRFLCLATLWRQVVKSLADSGNKDGTAGTFYWPPSGKRLFISCLMEFMVLLT